MEKSFETEVLTRLAVIESKLNEYNNIKEKAEVGYATSMHNKKNIEELQEKIKWLSRTIAGAIITAVVGIAFALIKNGMGVG